jgi:hypothetical protein
MDATETVSTTKLKLGWGWYLLIGVMAKFAEVMRFSHALSIVIEIALFCGIIYFYFKKRKNIYLKENCLPEFKISHASLRAGFYSLLLFLAGIFLTGLIDRLITRGK